jgi:hypothetical protein
MIITLLLTVLLAISYYISGKVLNPDAKDYDKTFRMELENKHFTKDYYDSLPKEELYLQSPYGYKMHAIYIPNSSSKKTVILVHGRTHSLMGSYKYVDIFRKRGFNALLVDNRNHGKSGGENSTFGYFERYDIKAWVDWVFEKTGQNSLVGFHGESLGAVISLMHMTVDKRPDFYVIDSPMANLSSTLGHSLKEDYGLPAFPLIPLTSLMSKMRGAMFFDDISPIQFIGDVKVPVFFIHGENDNYSLSENSKQLFESHPGHKKLWICPDAGHTQCVIINGKAYDRKIGEFLESIGIN